MLYNNSIVSKVVLVTFLISSFFVSANLVAQPSKLGAIVPTKDVPVHDPVMAKEGDTYYLFATGFGISVWSSKDMQNWRKEKPVFSQPPQWTVEAVPTFRGHIWAPDISYHNGLYYLYYSVSAFGKNTSCIGLVVNRTLDTTSADYKWIDHGKVIQSYPGVSNWNAIDPNIITGKKGRPYMSFGSFWGGLQLVPLTADRKSVAVDTSKMITIASRKSSPATANPSAVDDNPVDAGGNAIEAPFIFKKGGYYYLFASIDYCCKGIKSTYKMIVGRSKDVEGPYLDKDGNRMDRRGGTIVLEGDADWYGVGHNSVYTFDGKDYLVYHGYDAKDEGKSKLKIDELAWSNGWPFVNKKQASITNAASSNVAQ
ncbi:arabinan endo-1,5-alpha-L-arabinosidase [Aridibaculum aurantiacum]|uniref:arabinan endo-1,5-alpha-L-arabinosidase n=1 Tax=Aridibaculum aurantiacum TaxID=2810307 RepID=UPI001A977087|nr:arabinan endo-1,5-alpha-L-arabinosidase [Aridibaculum aurantiacum]